MTREEAKTLLPIIQGYVDGKKIETRPKGKFDEEWQETNLPAFNIWTYDYRIKSAPKYRSFHNAEECWQEMLKHQPFGWVKYIECYFNIIYIDDNHVVLADKDICSILLGSEHSCKDITFADGTPFGIKEEE